MAVHSQGLLPFLMPWRAARVLSAFGVTAGSFVALRQVYHGWCVVPNEIGFVILPVVFLAGFVWLVAELSYPLTTPLTQAAARRRLAAVASGIMLYAAIAGFTWSLDPTPDGDGGYPEYRGLLSAFWSVGMLVETGNFSSHSCGY